MSSAVDVHLRQDSEPLQHLSVDAFRAALRGQLLISDSPGYDAARSVWNAMIDRRPALIARCAGVADVICAVNFAREHGLLLAVRGGGHNVAGNAVCDGGLMIDLSLMKGIRVDPTRNTARAEPGVLWGELDHEMLAFGLTTTGGTVSTTGIAGLTLGGGLGWHMARHGLTCDNLLSVDLVTAAGELLTASESQNVALFWALRGGGGNFGVVVSFEYRLHPMAPTILGGMVLYPMEQAREVLQFYRRFSDSAPDDLSVTAAILTTPDGLEVVAIIPAWFGALEDGEQALAPLRTFGTPVADLVGPISYRQLQTMFDAAVPTGLRRYWKAGYVPDLSDDVIDHILAQVATRTSPYSLVLIFHLHGKAARVAPGATAFGARRAQWDVDIIPQWQAATEDAGHIAWARKFWSAIEPYTEGVYVNHLDGDDSGRVRAALGRNFDRLVAAKDVYDPENLFRMNNNIPPSGRASRQEHS